MKVYNNETSSEWSFSEDDAEVVQKRTSIDDGSYILSESQAQQHYDATCKLRFNSNAEQGKKRTRLTMSGQGDVQPSPVKAARTSAAASSGAAPAASHAKSLASSPDSKQSKGGAGPADDSDQGEAEEGPPATSALARKLGLQHEEVPRAKGNAKSKAAAKPAAKNAGKKIAHIGRKTDGAKLKTNVESVIRSIEAAEQKWKTIIACANLDDLKQHDTVLRDLGRKLKDKEDTLIGGGGESHLELYYTVHARTEASIALLKSWKAVTHTGNDKNKLAFQAAFDEFKQLCAEVDPIPSCCLQAGRDLIKFNVLQHCNKSEFAEACAVVSLQLLDSSYSIRHEVGSTFFPKILF